MNNSPINWHSVRTVLGLVIIFVVAGLGALHQVLTPAGGQVVDTIVAFLLILEHKYFGNSGTPTV